MSLYITFLGTLMLTHYNTQVGVSLEYKRLKKFNKQMQNSIQNSNKHLFLNIKWFKMAI